MACPAGSQTGTMNAYALVLDLYPKVTIPSSLFVLPYCEL